MAIPVFQAIKGEFVIRGKQPDGDSVRFVANNLDSFATLRNAHRIVPSRDGSIQLRLEGIDAPELHYGGETIRQPMGEESRNALLDMLGFTNVTYKRSGVVVSGSEPETIPGAIFTKAADIHGRPIAYLLVGGAVNSLNEGETKQVDIDQLKTTVNYRMVDSGMAYCFLYTSTPLEHRRELRNVARQARHANRGVWELDKTEDFVLRGQDDIGPSSQLILPKLFRRCTDYLKDVEKGFDGTLPEWMQATSHQNDKVVLYEDRIPFQDQVEVSFSDLVRQVNDHIVVQTDILNMIFVEH